MTALSGDARDRLAAALNDCGLGCEEFSPYDTDSGCPDCGDLLRLTDRLLPVVAELADQAAAEELRAIGREALAETPGVQRVHVPVDELFDRAEDLHPTPIRFEKPDRPSSLRGRAIPRRGALAPTTEGTTR